MTRGMMSQTRLRIDEAARDTRVVNAPLTVVMKTYGLSYANTQAAVESAWTLIRKRTKLHNAVTNRIHQDAAVVTVRSAEEKYPGIIKSAVASDNHAALGVKHKITRERVRQIAETARRLAKLLSVSVAEIARLASAGQLPVTEREELESSLSTS